jgi:hypothetical protein
MVQEIPSRPNVEDFYKKRRRRRRGEEISAKGKPITDSKRVNDIFRKFDSKYGGVKQYYPKVDVALEVPF